MSPTTYYLICLHDHCSQEAAEFIVESLTKDVTQGGANLIVEQQEMNNKSGGTLVLHVSATSERLFEIAESMHLKMKDNDGIIRPFQTHLLEKFPESGRVGPLTLAEVQRCILYAMELVHFDQTHTSLPGHPKAQIMKRSPVLNSYQEKGFIDMFPLHDDEMLRKLYGQWTTNPISPPINEIRDYFGENIALYVSFCAFYTKFLVPMALMGLIHYCLDRFLRFDFIYNNLLFAALNLIAVTIFLEMWKRRSNEHAFNFGTMGKLRHKRPRAAFRGDFGRNPVTGEDEVQYPMKKTLKTMLTVSVPVTGLCLVLAFVLMLLSFESDVWMLEVLKDETTGLIGDDMLSQALSFLPTIIYSVTVLIFNLKYLHLAHWLTEKENHRTQEQFERHVVAKLILFEFINTFVALFYIAFYLKDVTLLKSQVFTMLIVTQLVNQLQETILPFLLKRPSSRRMMHKIAKRIDQAAPQCQHHSVECIPCLTNDDSQVQNAVFSLNRDPYESTYDDFMELWLQFGHVFLFSSVYPLAAFFALLNNLFELKMDAYKLCKLTRKPTPRGVRDIGAWYTAFSITSIISVMTNLALLSMDRDVQDFAPNASSRDWILAFVVFEHLFILCRVIIAKAIPDVSNKIKLAMDINEYRLHGHIK